MAVVLTVLYSTGHCSVVAVRPSFLHSVDMPTWRASTYLTPFTTYVEVLWKQVNESTMSKCK